MLMSEGAGTFSSTEKEVIPERRTKKQLGEGKSAVDVRNAGERRLEEQLGFWVIIFLLPVTISVVLIVIFVFESC